MKVKKILLYGTLAVLSLSCQKLFIKPDKTSEPERNFEIFWNDINNGYPYFEEDKINWKERYDRYRPTITPSTSISQLFNIMTRMLSGFSDGHLSVSYNGDYFSNEKTVPNIIDLVREDAAGTRVSSPDPILHYLQNHYAISKSYTDEDSYNVITASNGLANSSIDTVCVYGYRNSDKILYINLTSFLTQYEIDNLLRKIFTQYADAKGLILDLRLNQGGNLGTMWNAVSVFVPAGIREVKYAYLREKVGPRPENFGKENYFAVSANNFNPKFVKPIVVLASRLSVSSAEHATMAMRELKRYNSKIKIIGDYTFGATSFIVERTLPCDIQYTLVNSKTSDINHQVIEKTGVRPDEFVYLTAGKILSNQDNQLERAIDIINNSQF